MYRHLGIRSHQAFAPILFLLLAGLVGGCASAPEPRPENARPDWIDEPGNGAVGSSTTHVKGRHYQEQLAIARAREKLAARLGVTVSSVQTINEKVRNDSASVTSDQTSVQLIENKTVHARVRETWYDRINDTIWVWLEPED